MRSFAKGTSLRAALLVSASVMSLAVASPEVWAADMPTKATYKAPPIEPLPQWTFFLEGAGFSTGGDPIFGVSALRPGFGWEGAVGVDYRFAASPWHVSAQFRYGKAGSKSATASGYGCFSGYCGTVFGTANHKEDHWVADFAVGHDLGVGTGQAQVKLGLRVAELNATTNLAGTLYFPSSGGDTVTAAGTLNFHSRFVGVGPRAGIEGSLPLSGAWGIDYMGGIAYLFGERSLDVSGAATGVGSFASNISDHQGVFNADASAGLYYAFSQNAKITAGYRFDGYWQSLKTVDANLNVVDVDRLFYGPFLRLTARY
jgi:hypothetical protein